MLVRFNVENFLSYKNNTEFSMLPGRAKQLSQHIIPQNGYSVLKSGIIYGANASGKSNLIRAVSLMKGIVSRGLQGVDTLKKHFRLETSQDQKETTFDIQISVNNKLYNYGFSIIFSQKKITEEWLYEVKKTKEIKVFHRYNTVSKRNIESDVSFHKSKPRFEIYSEDILEVDERLFLSEIANKKLTEFPELQVFNFIYEWFTETLTVIYPDTQYGNIARIGVDEDVNKKFCTLLEALDTGISGIDSIEQDFEETLGDLPEELKIDIDNTVKGDTQANINYLGVSYSIYRDNSSDELKVRRLGLKHKSQNNGDIIFEYEDESDGTQRLFDLLPAIELLQKRNKVFLIDELDRSLHPKLTRRLVELFLEGNTNESQLIVTTHESSLLDLKLLRRDEIWFVERDKAGESKLFSLDLFQERYDKEIRKAYLLGRYGAVPVFKSFETFQTDEV